MDKAFVQHAEHDVHCHDGGDNQPDGVAQCGLERQRAAPELGLNIGREAERFSAARIASTASPSE